MLTDIGRAKVNLTLRVVGRRVDGYHDLESVVAFADCADSLTLTPGSELRLETTGPMALACGEIPDNLVLKAASLLAERGEHVPGGDGDAGVDQHGRHSRQVQRQQALSDPRHVAGARGQAHRHIGAGLKGDLDQARIVCRKPVEPRQQRAASTKHVQNLADGRLNPYRRGFQIVGDQCELRDPIGDRGAVLGPSRRLDDVGGADQQFTAAQAKRGEHVSGGNGDARIDQYGGHSR